MKRFITRLFGKSSTRPATRARPRSSHLTLEVLEGREVPAFLDISGGVLSYTASVGETNTLRISQVGAYPSLKYQLQDSTAAIQLSSAAAARGWQYSDSAHHTVIGPTSSVSRMNIDLGDGTDTLIRGNGISASWSLTGANSGSLAVPTWASVDFQGAENLTGGATDDQFRFFGNGSVFQGGSVAGVINGGGQFACDTLDYSEYGASVTVNLQTNQATRTGGFRGIERVVGSNSATASDTLIGPNFTMLTTTLGMPVNNVWTIEALGTGRLNGSFLFTGIENLTGGAYNDTFQFADGQRVAGIINGAGGSDTLDYSASSSSVTVNLDTATATGASTIQNLERMIGGHGSDTLIAASVRRLGTLSVPLSNTVNVTSNNAGNLNGTFAFSSVENLTGGHWGDTFKLLNGAHLTGVLNGGGGSDTLDYSACATGVRVNLELGTAANVGAVTAVENVIGTAYNDVLIGNAVANVLHGGAGRDLLIGHDGADSLYGDAGDDILIGGRIDGWYNGHPVSDADAGALSAIMSEWARTDVSYALRVQHLGNGGGFNGNVLLNSATIVHDGAVDRLTGGTGLDWFFRERADTVTDRVSPERFN